MRRLVSILLLLLMLLQAIPVLHFFSSHKAIFYSYVDEEKPEQKSKVGQEDFHQHIVTTNYFIAEEEPILSFSLFVEKRLSPPALEFLTPPPDAC